MLFRFLILSDEADDFKREIKIEVDFASLHSWTPAQRHLLQL